MAEQVELSGPDFATEGVAVEGLAEMNRGRVGDEAVLIVRRGDEHFAIGASCTHYGGPLSDGIVEGSTIRCPYHHARFELSTGEAAGPPALNALPCYTLERRGDRLFVIGKKPAGDGPGGNPRRACSSSLKSVAIVGGGAAGAAAAETLRREGFDGTIALFAAEEATPIDRPNLSKDYLAGTAPEEWLPVRPDEFFGEQNIELRRLRATADELQGFDAVLLATGTTPIRLSIPGGERAHVLRTRSDARAIVAAAKQRAVIIGASFIGLEVAASLVARGLEVHVIGREQLPLERVLGRALGERVRDLHVEKGVHFHLGVEPRAIDEGSVVLDTGRVDGDVVVMGVGVRPDDALAIELGARVDRGVLVDAQLRTSLPNVWAAGDLARFPYRGELVRIEHWVVAQQHGQHAARTMLGDSRPFDAVPFFWSAHYDTTIGYVGHAESWDRIDERDGAYAYRRGEATLAVAAIGRDELLLRASAALERRDEAALRELIP